MRTLGSIFSFTFSDTELGMIDSNISVNTIMAANFSVENNSEEILRWVPKFNTKSSSITHFFITSDVLRLELATHLTRPSHTDQCTMCSHCWVSWCPSLPWSPSSPTPSSSSSLADPACSPPQTVSCSPWLSVISAQYSYQLHGKARGKPSKKSMKIVHTTPPFQKSGVWSEINRGICHLGGVLVWKLDLRPLLPPKIPHFRRKY